MPVAVNSGLDRRSFLAVGALATASGCMHCRLPQPPGIADNALSDAHAHFFNAADLPVAGFIRYVLAPRYFPGAPDLALALSDIIAATAKSLALTASEELKGLESGKVRVRHRVSESAFGREAEKAHRAGFSGTSYSQLPSWSDGSEQDAGIPELRLAGHRRLAQLIGPASAAGNPAPLRAEDFTRIVSAIPPEAFKLRDTAADGDLQCPEEPEVTTLGEEDLAAGVLLRWAYLMCQSRCSHVRAYLQVIRMADYRVRDAVNLLVDYDRWLDDAPQAGSGPADQVAYWTRYDDICRDLERSPIRLHTFAGYDPLRHAEETRSGGTSPYFDQLRQWALAGLDPSRPAARRVAGFKIYPPMGFRPDDNTGLTIPSATGNGRSILARWKGAEDQIGTELDKALDRFFEFCLENDVPILSHGRESNVALPGHGQDAEPSHWITCAEQLADKYPGKALRLCIAHFDLANCPKPTLDDAAVLRAALALNEARYPDGSPRARIHFDISFDENILAGGERARIFLSRLAEICRETATGADYLMFGSDWIMLANQAAAPDFLQHTRDATDGVGFWRANRDKLFSSNLRHFLKLT